MDYKEFYMKLTHLQEKELLDWYNNGNTPIWLYEAFMEDMPYGTAKARTGDPDSWLSDHIDWVEDRFGDENYLKEKLSIDNK